MNRVLFSVFLGIVVAVGSLSQITPLQAQNKNSTRKIRIQPTEFSGKCGSAVQWRESVDAAIQESATSDKPVFWYVPTIRGSFMDRKPVIDQYMMAGPFSWPSIVGLLNDHFVPVKAVARDGLQRRFEHLKRYEFVEPGFVILNPDGTVKTTIDQLTTLDPYWMSSLIAGWAGVETPSLWHMRMEEQVAAYRDGNYSRAETRDEATGQYAIEHAFLSAMIEYSNGNHETAREVWQSIAERFPESPLAWKAAAEAENWGPFVRGFEVHRRLPEKAYRAGVESRGSAAPQATYSQAELWQRSTDYLLRMQASDGGWIDSDYDFGGTDSLPNVYVAVSSLCGNALIQALDRVPEKRDQIMKAVEAAAVYCSDPANLNLDDRDEILWAHAYRVRFFARLVKHSPKFRERYAEYLQDAVTDLESVQTRRGTWYHEYPNSFVTATALTALKRGADAGATIDQEKIKRGVASLANDRFDNGAWPYSGHSATRVRGTAESSGRGQIPASAGRMPLCELGLWLWGGSDDERLQFALQSAFENHKHLAVAYKYDNHTSTMAYGGFFFWYDMRSRAETLGFMTAGETRSGYVTAHRNLVLNLPELDGCFVDSHELGRCYGTAMALLTLSILDEIQ